MPALDSATMRAYLGRSISSLNQNKMNGLLAEVNLRRHLEQLGYLNRVSPRGWILPRVGAGRFGESSVVVFPDPIQVGRDLPVGRNLPNPPNRLHTICATFHQSAIHAFFCAAEIAAYNGTVLCRQDS